LFLAVSLLTFGWVSIVVATRRRRPGLVALLGYSPSPGLGALRVLSAGVAGVSLGVVAIQMIPNTPSVLLLLAAMGVAAATLVGLQVLTDRWSYLYPNAARRLARPGRWFGNSSSTPDNVPASPANSEFSASPAPGPASTADGDDADFSETDHLTADEILNLDRNDIDMVRSISRMDDREVQEIMVPRLDIDALDLSSSMEQVVNAFVATRHTRLPVYRETMDDVVGVVHISDVLKALVDNQPDAKLEVLMRAAEFVAENMAVDDLLHLMRTKSLQFVIVVDEYGGVEGLATFEDVLEEIVGDIDDEFDAGDPDAPVLADDGSWMINAKISVEDVSRIVGVPLNKYDVNTIGGYVYTELGRMPAMGDVIRNGDLCIEVVETRGRRIEHLRLSRSEVSVPSVADSGGK